MRLYAPLEKGVPLPDVRLRRRLVHMIDQFTAQPNCTIPQATEHRNDMDAVYAFFANPRVGPANILDCCLPETCARLTDCPRLLILQDTSEANFSSLVDTDDLGYTAGSGVRGLLIHSSLAVRPDGLSIGLLTQQIWTRDPATKGRTKKRRQRTACDKESFRWLDHARAARSVLPAEISTVHIADREGDIYDWFAAPRPEAAHLLVRVAQAHRIVVHGPDGQSGKLAAAVRAVSPSGRHELDIPRADDRPSRVAVVTLRVLAVRIPPPVHAKNRKELSSVPAWVIEAVEENPPAGQKGLCWRLVSTEPMTDLEKAIRALGEYALRWRIERFHYILKQGCEIERLQLESADRLSNAIAVYSQVAVRLLRLTYLARVEADKPVEEEFTASEVEVLRGQSKRRVATVAEAVGVIARLGGHLGRKGDDPPGAKVLWRGLRRLHDQVLGYQILQPRSEPDTRNG